MKRETKRKDLGTCDYCGEPLETSAIEVREITRDILTLGWETVVYRRFCDQVCAQRWYREENPAGLGVEFDATGELVEQDAS